MNNQKVEDLGQNPEVYSGHTYKVNGKYYIISRSPFNGEVMVFKCRANGTPTTFRHVYLTYGQTSDAINWLTNNQP